jgi:hypothetical protein
MKIYLFSSAKVLLLFEIRKFLHKKMQNISFFLSFYAIFPFNVAAEASTIVTWTRSPIF